MSRLENLAKPILIDLIELKRTIWQLTAAESAIVAKWAAKSTYVLASASVGKRPCPPKHPHQLAGDAGTVPAHVGVFGCQVAYDKDISYLQIAHWPQMLVPGDVAQPPNDPHPDAYKTVVQYRNLILLVAYWPYQPSQFVLASGLHTPIWPLKPVWPSYVNHNLEPFSSSLPILKAFAETLAVMQSPTQPRAS